mmetsp:Transcript_9063/g.39893  ORF Transcript_9063/g.39893 Transcript_9063/m.39893 type:complete len:91 (+) Transcript_9063:5918-6190(+)
MSYLEALAISLRTSQFFEILLFAIHDSKFTIHTLYMLIRVVRGQIFCTCEFSAVMLYIVMFPSQTCDLTCFQQCLRVLRLGSTIFAPVGG